jgi:translation initiation factor IF-2
LVKSKIRINDLARELEVKSRSVLDYLHEIGISDKKSHSSAIDDDVADKVRAHFREASSDETDATESEPVPDVTTQMSAPAPTAAPERATVQKPVPSKFGEIHHEVPILGRTLEQIKAEARRAVAPVHKPVPPSAAIPTRTAVPAAAPRSPTRPGMPPTPTPAMPSASARTGSASPRAPETSGGVKPGVLHRPPAVAHPTPGHNTGKPDEPASLRPAASTASGPAAPPMRGHAPAPGRSGRAGRGVPPSRKPPAADQPIYPGVAAPRAVPGRGMPLRRPGEHRPMHPTARPVGSGATASAGAATGVRPYPSRPGQMPSRQMPSRGPSAYPVPRPVVPEEVPITKKITITEGVTIKELSEKLDVRAKDVIKRLLEKGVFATINQTLDSQTATELARTFGAETAIISFEEEVLHLDEDTDRPEDLQPRAPVVTVMGHVDHGKTSLLDAIRETNVVAKEAGGITQHIGAYHVEVNQRKVVFLDTPGHEAFTLMRARGAKVTDIVVLVVAADDGVMPQTLEAINHARAAKVPIIVAINKIDKPEALPERVKRQLADLNLMPEDWGGDTVTVEVSAKQHKNLELLLEMILLVADLQGLKANPTRLASGTVLEAKLDRGRGPVATVLIQNGTIRVGDAFIVGAIYGKVRAMFDDRGRAVTEATPSTPIEMLGLEDVPQAGDRLQSIEDTAKARQIAVHRQAKMREAALAKTARLTLEQLHQQLAAGDVKELPLIVKGDVQGSVEVVSETLTKLSDDRVKVKVIHAGVGAITETDVLLASASNAVVVGFNVRPERKASELAALEKVDIRLHTIIYELADEIRKAKVGLLAVRYKEISLGRIEVRDTFRVAKVGTIAGCYVVDGKFKRDSRVRLLRDSVVVYEGKVRSLRRFKDDVEEVRSGMECGVALENFSDVKVGDVIEAFVTERVAEEALA